MSKRDVISLFSLKVCVFARAHYEVEWKRYTNNSYSLRITAGILILLIKQSRIFQVWLHIPMPCSKVKECNIHIISIPVPDIIRSWGYKKVCSEPLLRKSCLLNLSECNTVIASMPVSQMMRITCLESKLLIKKNT